MFADAKENEIADVHCAAQSVKNDLNQDGSMSTDAKDARDARALKGHDSVLERGPKLTRSLSFSSNGLLPEAGEEEVNEIDIDRISHLKPKLTSGMTASKSLASLACDGVADDGSKLESIGASTSTTLQLNSTGTVSTHAPMKGAFLPGMDNSRAVSERCRWLPEQ